MLSFIMTLMKCLLQKDLVNGMLDEVILFSLGILTHALLFLLLFYFILFLRFALWYSYFIFLFFCFVQLVIYIYVFRMAT